MSGVIFVPDFNADIEEYSSALKWLKKNPESQNILELREQDILLLQYNSGIIDIINEENGGFLQNGEDDWIFEEEVKESVHARLTEESKKNLDTEIRKILTKIIDLLEVSLHLKTNIYFIF